VSERAPDPPPKPRAVGAGRGLVFITGAKLWFMVAGYVVQFALPRALGSPERWGVWVLVLALVSPLNNVMVTATIQSVSRFAAESDERAGAVVRAALRLQALLGGGTALAFFLAAPGIAWFMHDAALTSYLRLATGVVLAYAFYAVFVGAANGAREFHKQAGLDMTFATLRATLVVGAGAVTHSALAAVGGFVAAAGAILVIALLVVGLGPRPAPGAPPFPLPRLARFFVGVAAYLFIVNLLMFVDGYLLKRLVAEHAAAAGAADPSAVANAQEGFYGAAQAIARIPYQLILAVTFVVFPLISKATFEADQARTRRYVEATLRYSLCAVTLFAVCLGARPDAVMRLLYKPEYAVGAPALAALLVGYVCFSLFTIAGTILNGAGHTLPPMFVGLATFVATVALTWAGIGLALERGADPLLYAAAATALGMGLGVVGFLAACRRAFGAALPPVSLARVSLAAAGAVALARLWPAGGFLGGKVGTLLSVAGVGAAFVALVVAIGEVRPRELLASRRA
jgi:stage V sporulation protein B